MKLPTPFAGCGFRPTGHNDILSVAYPGTQLAGCEQQSPVQLPVRERGFSPLWAHSGSELFFVDVEGGSLIAAQVETASGFRVLQRETLFALGTGLLVEAGVDYYDIAPDDQRFLMLRRTLEPTSGAGETKFILVQNFFEELKRLVPN